jgi:hypothetical protein
MEANTDKSAIIGLIEFSECLGTGWDHDFPVPLVVVLNRGDDRSLDGCADGRFKPSHSKAETTRNVSMQQVAPETWRAVVDLEKLVHRDGEPKANQESA